MSVLKLTNYCQTGVHFSFMHLQLPVPRGSLEQPKNFLPVASPRYPAHPGGHFTSSSCDILSPRQSGPSLIGTHSFASQQTSGTQSESTVHSLSLTAILFSDFNQTKKTSAPTKNKPIMMNIAICPFFIILITPLSF